MKQRQMEMSQEDMDRIQSEIPEWKQGAVILSDQQAEEEERKGLLRKLTGKVTEKLSQT